MYVRYNQYKETNVRYAVYDIIFYTLFLFWTSDDYNPYYNIKKDKACIYDLIADTK